MEKKVIGNFSNSRDNNFDIMRFIAATFVIISHSFPLSGSKIEPFAIFTKGQETFGGLGVAIFFVMSGFLISQSYERNPNIIAFLKARILRIFPALVVVTFVAAFMLGPMVTTLSINNYFMEKQPYIYFWQTATLYTIHYHLPGVFQNNAYVGAVNGSLWTLPYEFSFYLIVGSIGMIRILKNKEFIFFFFLVVLALSATNNVDIKFKLFSYFGAGIFINAFRDYIPLSKKYVVLCFLLLTGTIYFGKGFSNLFPICGSYLIMYFIYSPDIKLNKFGKYGDCSYGLYVYAFPIQQLVTYWYDGRMSVLKNFSLSFFLTFIIAMASWHLVEKHFLKLKKYRFLKSFRL